MFIRAKRRVKPDLKYIMSEFRLRYERNSKLWTACVKLEGTGVTISVSSKDNNVLLAAALYVLLSTNDNWDLK